ncbi:AAA family ATPase [Gephyromycinifex aptenodytis]|uniref:AAA family ATPase n=1 Tax=Gephyromycinifex aptenodytis TaxID=2716227 RepID=UPI0014454B60|nr:MoxR family ATPase [Gephyromycinifex aptenodytis]
MEDSDLQHAHDLAAALTRATASVIEGKNEVIEVAVTVLLAGGHLLLEDVPGVGKTTLAKALAQALGIPMRRIQFTPDLLPSDVTGVNVFDPATGAFRFRPGAIFAHIVVCDEINRASPKAQSAVLESMEEAQVSVDGETYPLPNPFLVVATQNPLEMEGTYPLPEAQRDRFMARLAIGYPSAEAEAALLEQHSGTSPLARLDPVATVQDVQRAATTVQGVYAAPALRHYIVNIVRATRTHPELRLGASPRAGLHLLRAARAAAVMSGRAHVLPDDVQQLAVAVLEHRVLLAAQGRLSGRSPAEVIAQVLGSTPVPALRSTAG